MKYLFIVSKDNLQWSHLQALSYSHSVLIQVKETPDGKSKFEIAQLSCWNISIYLNSSKYVVVCLCENMK